MDLGSKRHSLGTHGRRACRRCGSVSEWHAMMPFNTLTVGPSVMQSQPRHEAEVLKTDMMAFADPGHWVRSPGCSQ